MLAKSDKHASASPAANAHPNPDQKSLKMILPLGRGRIGKSFWSRWLIDRTRSQGRTLVIADADRRNPCLTPYFDGVLTPSGDDELSSLDWFSAISSRQIEEQSSALVDLGPDAFPLTAVDSLLVPFLEDVGIQRVAVHLIGPHRDDLAFLRDLEAGGLFAPEATIIVLNKGLVASNRDPERAFQSVLSHQTFKAAIKRGAVPVWMPWLEPASEVEDNYLSLSEAEAGGSTADLPPLGFFSTERIAIWRSAMESAFAPVMPWLT